MTDAGDSPPARYPRSASAGVLPSQAIAEMVRAREITAEAGIDPAQIQPASLDLRLGCQAYRVRASFLPGAQASVMEKVAHMDGFPAIDLAAGAVLEKGLVYVVQLAESVRLPDGIVGLANPKSSTGRLDILTRLIADHGMAFDRVEPGYDGPLYIEIAPQTFSIVVRQGTRLNQLRFQRGRNADLSPGDLLDLYGKGQLIRTVHEPQPPRDGLVPVTIDLKGGGPGSVVGYQARKHTGKIDIDRPGTYGPEDFWHPIRYHPDRALILDPDEFYILATCEEVGVPPYLAAEMVPYYASAGEYRVHYAGFFDPGFGWDGGAGGSKAVLEVRSHGVPFALEHGQTVGWLRYARMAGVPDRHYGAGIHSHYQNQGLTLAKQFRPFAPMTHELDARGLKCPLPVLKARKALKAVPIGEVLTVLATDPGAPDDFVHFCATTGNELIGTEPAGDHTRIAVRRLV